MSGRSGARAAPICPIVSGGTPSPCWPGRGCPRFSWRRGDIADGYHRVSLAYALDPYSDVPLKLG
jgi:hypothetical protein